MFAKKSYSIPRLCLCLSVVALLAGCSPRQLIVGNLADELAAQGQAAESDLELARDAAPFYLKLSESVLRQQPGHAALAESVAAGFTQYSYAFVASEAERVEADDAKAAELLRRRAAALYRRAHQHALQALERLHAGFVAALRQADEALWPVLRHEEVGLAYWAAASWGGWISLSKDDPDVVADLPLAVRLAELARRADPAWGSGATTSLRATLEASRHGGDRKLAERWFDEAIARSGGRLPSPLLAKAEGIALPAGDRQGFEQLLNQALALEIDSNSPQALQTQVVRRRAAWLLEKSPDLF